MKFNRKINPNPKSNQNFITKKRLREDEINFDKLRSYRIDRVKKELEKNNLEACILFDPVNIRYALDTVNMSIYNMHNLTRYCFIPVNGPIILYEYFNCEKLSENLNLIDEIMTSDEFILEKKVNYELIKVEYALPKSISDKISAISSKIIKNILDNLTLNRA